MSWRNSILQLICFELWCQIMKESLLDQERPVSRIQVLRVQWTEITRNCYGYLLHIFQWLEEFDWSDHRLTNLCTTCEHKMSGAANKHATVLRHHSRVDKRVVAVQVLDGTLSSLWLNKTNHCKTDARSWWTLATTRMAWNIKLKLIFTMYAGEFWYDNRTYIYEEDQLIMYAGEFWYDNRTYIYDEDQLIMYAGKF
jgi:hypothetical protein